MTTPFDSAVARVRAGEDHHLLAAELVAEMTVEERLGCLDGDLPFWPGLFDMTAGGYYEHPWPAAVVERLGIPGIQFADGPRGCVVGNATAFPVAMARGASFDPALEAEIGEAIGAELRASGATFTGAVCLNLLRHPGWGRAQETYGEDPHHVGEMAAALTRGLQRHVMACMKHFALNSMENARFTVDVEVDDRALHEVYLPHFRRVAEEGVASTMSAYNSVRGEWCGENTELLTTILRDEWGWDGFVISDFIFGVRDGVASVRAGLDIEMPFRMRREMSVAEGIADGDLPMSDVDAAVTRIVATLLRFAEQIEHSPPAEIVASSPHVALARRAAAQSTVLLRNDALLPLEAGTIERIAVLGRLADVANLGDGGSSDVHPPYAVTPLGGLRTRFPDAELVHSDDDVSIVDGADVVVVVVGYTKNDEGEYVDPSGTAPLAAELFPSMDHPDLGRLAPLPFEPAQRTQEEVEDRTMAPGGDRRSLRLSPADEALIEAACAAHNRVIVVVEAGSAVVMPWLDQTAAALQLWYGGMAAGDALADVLSGDVEPGGRLPFAVPTDEAHLVHFDPDATTETYGLLHGQWYLDDQGVEAALPFGFGLGYTDFAVTAAERVGDSVRVEALNVGGRVGSTVVMVFAAVPDSAFERPAQRLVGFAKVSAEPGESAVAEIQLDLRQLHVRQGDDWLVEAAPIELTVAQRAHDPSALTI